MFILDFLVSHANYSFLEIMYIHCCLCQKEFYSSRWCKVLTGVLVLLLVGTIIVMIILIPRSMNNNRSTSITIASKSLSLSLFFRFKSIENSFSFKDTPIFEILKKCSSKKAKTSRSDRSKLVEQICYRLQTHCWAVSNIAVGLEYIDFAQEFNWHLRMEWLLSQVL
jgi:hypothetical protein